MPLKSYTLELPTIKAQRITPENFQKFGALISPSDQISTIAQSAANQGTAIKLHKVSPIINKYENCDSKVPSSANWNIFRCKVPNHLISAENQYTAKVLERHPFSTQTFLPLGVEEKEVYLVIVALDDPTTDENLPDLSSISAFLCDGSQAVTYGLGVWHAPMIVLKKSVDFAVLVHENGVPTEDCEECYFDPGFTIQY